MVQVAIISDTHARLDPRIKKIIDHSDIAIHAGDICNADILQSMQPKSGKVIAVAGNNDQPSIWPEHQQHLLSQLPEIDFLDLPGGRVVIEHGHKYDRIKPSHDEMRKAYPTARLIVYGHTHRKVIDDFQVPWVVNPGAAGENLTRGGPSCLVLKAREDSWQIESFRFPS